MADDPQDPPVSDDAPPTDPPADPPEGPALGDAGKKAIDAERSARRKAEREAKAAQEELDRIKAETATDQEKALAAARKEGESEATAKANIRIIRSEVKAAAAKKLNDPNDAIAMLDLALFEVDADGNVDDNAISAAIDELVTAKPYLAAGAKPATGNGDGGAHETPGELSVAQQIADAEVKGDWRTSTSLKSQLLVEQLNQ